MPELAEVEYYRKQWSPGIGCHVDGVELRVEKRVFRGQDLDALQTGLIGQALERSLAHGKQMLFVFGQVHWMGVHLGMTGKTRCEPPGYLAEKHDHLLLRMKEGPVLVFSDPRMFGRILYSRNDSDPDWWSRLPAEILSDGFSYDRMEHFLIRRGKSPIKAVLLIQEFFPGVGNWMADEILWRCRIRPDTPAGAINPQCRIHLYHTIKEVCADAMRVIGTDWGTPPDSWLFNHRWKDGGICPQTGEPLCREEIGGRTTCWSPAWQINGQKS